MSDYLSALNKVDTALEYLRSGGEPLELSGVDNTLYEKLGGLPDDTVVEDYASELRDFGPSVILASTEEEFEQTITLLGVVMRRPFEKSVVNDRIAHERFHHMAAQQMGYRVMIYALSVLPPENGIPNAIPFSTFAEPSGVVTKLAIGAQYAAPPDPSPDDNQILRMLRYKGAQDVGNRMATSKNPRLSSLWLPESFRRATGVSES